jgi:predicted HAD superfamily Cof-like phosphohydrolase
LEKISKNHKLLKALFKTTMVNTITREEALRKVVELSNKVDFLVTHLYATDQTNGLFKAFSPPALRKLEADRLKNKLPDRPNYLADVLDFMTFFNFSPQLKPTVPTCELSDFRLTCLREEVIELQVSLQKLTTTRDPRETRGLMAEVLDALVDLTYFALGTVHAFGLGSVFGTAWRRVHAANMKKVRVECTAKRGPYLDVVKPSNWQAPNHTDLINWRNHV